MQLHFPFQVSFLNVYMVRHRPHACAQEKSNEVQLFLEVSLSLGAAELNVGTISLLGLGWLELQKNFNPFESESERIYFQVLSRFTALGNFFGTWLKHTTHQFDFALNSRRAEMFRLFLPVVFLSLCFISLFLHWRLYRLVIHLIHCRRMWSMDYV